MRKLSIILMLLIVSISNNLNAQNYAEVLQKSMFFYEAQRAGVLPATNRVEWRGNACVNDGNDVGADLRKGWFDAGDNVKFNFPMAWSVTVLSWGALEYPEGYASSGQMPYLLDNIKWVTDYFIACHPQPNIYHYQVGDGDADHATWTAAEISEYIMERPTATLNPSTPGTEVSAETAAAMAAASLLFKSSDPAYSAELLQHAIDLYNFAETYLGDYPLGAFYKSWSGYNDELTWGAIWLYKATGDEAYLAKAEAAYDLMGKEIGSNTPVYKHTFSWDDKAYACYVLLAQITGKEKYKNDSERFLDFWTYDIERTPDGLPYQIDNNWGILRYASNTALCALVYSDLTDDATKKQDYYNMAKSIADYAMGNNSENLSYVVGYGSDWPKHIHHRTAHGWPDGFPNGDVPDNRHILYGALVGGPNFSDEYNDDINAYEYTEVACDYNAAFAGVICRLTKDYGGTPVVGFPAPEERNPQFYVNMKLNVASSNSIELLGWLVNASAWPARYTENLAFRYYIDISEGLSAGFTAADYTTSGSGATSALIPYDVENNIYYVEMVVENTAIYPGGEGEKQEFVRINVGLPGATNDAWDTSNDWSYQGVAAGSDYVYNAYMPCYENGEYLDGLEPDGGEIINVEEVQLAPANLDMCIGEMSSLNTVVLPSNASNKKVSFESSNTNVVSVGANGQLVAQGVGSAVVTVTTDDGGFTATCDVTVSDCQVHVTGVDLVEETFSVFENESGQLTVNVLPGNATNKSVTWSTSNASIATVSSTGMISAIVEGNAVIYATTVDGGFIDSCLVTVNKKISNQYAYPNGVPHVIPGTINATHFDVGGNNEAYFDVDAGNNGTGPRQDEDVDTESRTTGDNVGWIAAGEWLEYTIDVQQTGAYTIEIEVASMFSTGAYHIEFGGQDKTGLQAVPATGDWGTFIVQKIENVNLVAGEQIMRVFADGYDFNIADVKLSNDVPCETTPITAYVALNDGALIEASQIVAEEGDVVVLSPQTSVSGTWNWTGPNAYTASDREISLTGIQKSQEGNYTATFTNDCGTQSTQVFEISVVAEPVYYTMSIITEGPGIVEISPVKESYLEGETVTVNAIANEGASFVAWSGDLSGTATTLSVVMNKDINAVATFKTMEEPCSNPTPIDLTFVHEKAGTYCWVTSDEIDYINSWCTDEVTINGVDVTNLWMNSLPPKIDGKYFIYFKASVDWAHFEANSLTKSAKESKSSLVKHVRLEELKAYPNPLKEGNLAIEGTGEIIGSKINIHDTNGKIVYSIEEVISQKTTINRASIKPGIYFISVEKGETKKTIKLVVE